MILTLINMTFKLLSKCWRHQQNQCKNLIILCCSVENGSFDACLLRLEMSSVNIENWSFIARNRKSEIARNQKNVSSLETPSKVRCDASQSILRHLYNILEYARNFNLPNFNRPPLEYFGIFQKF